MTPVELSRQADTDLEDILDYSIAAHGRGTAEAYLRGIDAAFSRLSQYPELGSPRPDLKEGLRSLPYGEHRIYYRYDGMAVLVARVLHKATDTERHL
ncbi:MAG: plasmid stabilization system family protein [Alphaproteobacteria bacterium]|nr:plasmid stabilization system family protein [Alphaproteobacteria bacterium]